MYALGDTLTFESINYEVPVEIIYHFIKFDKKGKPYVDWLMFDVATSNLLD